MCSRKPLTSSLPYPSVPGDQAPRAPWLRAMCEWTPDACLLPLCPRLAGLQLASDTVWGRL
eukprot:scaffold234124_cov35-Tisochrysis_lutea.AAC.2